AADGDCEDDWHASSFVSVGAISRSRRLRAGSIAARLKCTSHGATSIAITSNQTYPDATPDGGLPSGIPRPGRSCAQRQTPIDVPYSSSAATTRNTPAYTARERERQRNTQSSGTPNAPATSR